MLLNGVDLTRISRFKDKSLIFAKKILSANEFQEFQKLSDIDSKSLFLARSWAIKEAIFKADNQYFNFSSIDLIKINKRWTFKDFSISISHEGDLLIAFVTKLVK
ncbi:holo-acyl-carrier protein synthase [Mycoplasmopsis canis UF31]|uniref:4'-phosphopantetheinyl transferase superfamily protein n=1 Tax=Mycoplasmopsis canis TaxID=29555 RepID=UPI00025ADC13|nr:4'-phosphopantetheinyl transferase superfamily protein [Mycoplasmopsis canis]EIE41061.1 holo-acyl-carrier protein synthase [Mycoplasmopsis canis UF31]